LFFRDNFIIYLARWKLSDGSSERLTPTIHKSQISSLKLLNDGTLISTG